MKNLKSKIRPFLRWILARPIFYQFNKLMYSVSLNGLGIFNDKNDRTTGEYSFLIKTTKYFGKDAVVLDVGANIGRYSNQVKKLNPQTKIYAFEPHPITFKILEKNAQINGYYAFQVGCGREKAQLKLYDYEHQNGSSHASIFKDVIEDIHQSNSIEHIVDVIDLDSFLVEQNIKKVNLLKIDVEGNEYSVLQGLNKSIKNGLIDLIHFEFNAMNVISRTFMKDFYEILSDYRLCRMLPNGLIPLGEYNPLLCEIYAFQNIVAIHKNSEFNL